MAGGECVMCLSPAWHTEHGTRHSYILYVKALTSVEGKGGMEGGRRKINEFSEPGKRQRERGREGEREGERSEERLVVDQAAKCMLQRVEQSRCRAAWDPIVRWSFDGIMPAWHNGDDMDGLVAIETIEVNGSPRNLGWISPPTLGYGAKMRARQMRRCWASEKTMGSRGNNSSRPIRNLLPFLPSYRSVDCCIRCASNHHE
ncbi:hypothetical protein BO78DRAFT_133417 [Aspergillus sclerotiicarbonarius CBS 121057]|uniref:Uncharacterized protein n=1 Tax=Aspergillus sclerotiicarbonarius (strain CBS 121057 / IBT 28362) TaxID=1448318 RepID=A0A319EMA4_ASPSB|nr:hypothetical protein BO78DRAFT_133417 [Aspergillus sclerotiicarbonarius CBS 121057]